MKLNNNELLNVMGGALTATFFNSISRLLSTVMDFGQKLGSSLRRILGKSYCKI